MMELLAGQRPHLSVCIAALIRIWDNVDVGGTHLLVCLAAMEHTSDAFSMLLRHGADMDAGGSGLPMTLARCWGAPEVLNGLQLWSSVGGKVDVADECLDIMIFAYASAKVPIESVYHDIRKLVVRYCCNPKEGLMEWTMCYVQRRLASVSQSDDEPV